MAREVDFFVDGPLQKYAEEYSDPDAAVSAGQIYFCHEEQEAGPSPYIEMLEDGTVMVAMGQIIFLPR